MGARSGRSVWFQCESSMKPFGMLSSNHLFISEGSSGGTVLQQRMRQFFPKFCRIMRVIEGRRHIEPSLPWRYGTDGTSRAAI
mmetsp:Transcript_25916/g.76669  ORF Transcript_25916/g.76669 Transcript_25916/m.76669 type:complete len:83 (+) Transcript_25916:116-364(+)